MITIYGKENCPWCIRAKDLAEQYSLKYTYLDIGINPELRTELFERHPETKTVPQIWWDDRHLGGYEALASEIQNTIGGFGEQRL
jgi:glutaredoxin 3